MSLRRNTAFCMALAASLAMAAAGAAMAQSYPSKPISVVVPYPPGGSTDSVARLVGERLGARLGQPVVVENRPGASGVVAAGAVLRQPADGYTLMLVVSSHVLIDKTMANLSYSPLRDFRGVGPVVWTDFALLANPRTAKGSLKEVLEQIKEDPASLNWGMVGVNGMGRMAVVQFEDKAGVKLSPVPYQGTAPLLTAVSGGDIDYAMDVVGSFVPQIQAGRVRGLAVSGDRRLPEIPEVPTFAEAGLPEFSFGMWYGLLAPSATPDTVVDVLSQALAAVLAEPDVRQRLAAMQLQPLVMSPREFDQRMEQDSREFARLVERAGIRPE